MKLIIILTFSLLTFQAIGQNFILPDGKYMDTTTTDSKDTNCITSPYFYYYSFGAKYPKNSASLLNEAQLFLQKQNAIYSGSGYITLCFNIDCQGKIITWHWYMAEKAMQRLKANTCRLQRKQNYKAMVQTRTMCLMPISSPNNALRDREGARKIT
jgi:hypothetical protein